MRTVIVALLSGVVGSVLTYLIHRREIGVKMIEVAIGILRGEPDDNTKALRDWRSDPRRRPFFVNASVPPKPNQRSPLERDDPCPIPSRFSRIG